MWICMKRSTGSSLRPLGKASEGASDHVWAGRAFLYSCQHDWCPTVMCPVMHRCDHVNSMWWGSGSRPYFSLSWLPLPLCRQQEFLTLENLVWLSFAEK